MLSNVRHDIRYALRTLRRNPGFAVAAIVPIALGIGLNTAVFSILNSVAWRPLPVPEPDALVSVYQDFRGGPRRTVHGARSLFSLPEYRTYRDEAHTLASLMAYSRRWTLTLGREFPQEIEGILVTCNYFDVLGLSPAIGAGFTADNCGTPDASPAVVLSHALWTIVRRRSRFCITHRPERTRCDGRGVACRIRTGVDMAKEAFLRRRHGGVPAGAEPPGERARELRRYRRRRLDDPRRFDGPSMVARRIDRTRMGRTTRVIVEPVAALSLPVARRDFRAYRRAAFACAAHRCRQRQHHAHMRRLEPGRSRSACRSARRVAGSFSNC